MVSIPQTLRRLARRATPSMTPVRTGTPPRVTAVANIVSDAFEGIPGIGPMSLDSIDMGPPAHVRIAFRGWSPSLHTVNVNLDTRVDLAMGRSPDHIAEQILAQVADAIARQKDRAASAKALWGRDEPLELGNDIQLDHLHVDASLDALCRSAGYTLASRLAYVVRHIHSPTFNHDGSTDDKVAQGHVAERPELSLPGEPLIREAGMVQAYDGTDTHPPFVFDGATLSIYCEAVPETVASMLPGRPVSDLILLHPALDERIIREVEQVKDGSDRINVQLVPELVRYRDLPR